MHHPPHQVLPLPCASLRPPPLPASPDAQLFASTPANKYKEGKFVLEAALLETSEKDQAAGDDFVTLLHDAEQALAPTPPEGRGVLVFTS